MTIRKVRAGATGHRYEIDGKKAIGVTTAIGLAVAKPNLMKWAARCTAEEAVELFFSDGDRAQWGDPGLIEHLAKAAERRRNAAAVRGTKVHQIAEDIVDGKEVVTTDELYPYAVQCARFIDDWKIRPLLKENVIGHHRWGYAGTFDLVAEVGDGRRILFDYKTGKRVFPEVMLQLAAYRWADAYVAEPGMEVPMSEVGITESKVVHLGPDGYQVVPVESGEAEFKTFLHVLQVARAVLGWGAWQAQVEVAPA